jgi:tetratricopeptide (TPR) repeat protein
MRACRLSLSHWLALCLVFALPTMISACSPAAEPSAPVLIGGVPFVSAAEGSTIEHPSLMFQHPRSRAAHMMALRYYRPEAKTWDDYLKATDEKKGPLREKWGEAKGLDELRVLVSAGNPVIVVTASTPYAHELYPVFEMLLRAGAEFGVKLKDLDSQDYSSRILGRMVGLDVQRKIGEAKQENVQVYGKPPQGAPLMNPLHEIATRCARVVVGLDPARRVVIVHDPEFGPASEVPFDDFEVMWSAADHMYCVLAPKGGARPSVTATSAYPPRTPDQRAAECYLYGYSLAATGKAAEADERYRAGLSLDGLSAGYRFLFLQERGFLAYRRRQWEEAVSLLRQATEQVPQAPGPWFWMAQICRETGAAGGKSAADEFQRTAEKLAGDEAGLRAGMQAFPDNLNLATYAPLITLTPGPPPE